MLVCVNVPTRAEAARMRDHGTYRSHFLTFLYLFIVTLEKQEMQFNQCYKRGGG